MWRKSISYTRGNLYAEVGTNVTIEVTGDDKRRRKKENEKKTMCDHPSGILHRVGMNFTF